jgi:putative ABC transport system substrate-binding protein
MHLRLLAATAICLSLAWTSPLPGQQPPRRHRLGVFLWHDSPNDLATLVGIRAGLERAQVDAEFVEHHAQSDPAAATAAFTALRQARCELVFVLGTQAALLAKDALVEVPVVFAAVSDAVASGVVPDWSGSGRNLCGASNWIAPAAVLDVFRLAVPRLKRLGMIRSQTSGVVSAAELVTMRAHVAATPGLDLTIVESVARDAADVERAATALLVESVDAIWIPIDLMVYQDLAAVRRGLGRHHLPLLTTAAAGVTNGAHVGAAVDYDLHGRRAAALAVRLLRHQAEPGTLPIDRMRSTLVQVNLGAARRDGIELPLSILAVADELLAPEADHGKR